VTSVDNYQGEENDIELLSLVRSNSQGIIGFLNTSNRICVALSRAKHAFYIIGNGDQLKGNSTWNSVIQILTQMKFTSPASDQLSLCGFSSELPLVCQHHPNKTFAVKTAQDFKTLSPEGGCTLQCSDVLPCGHQCNLACHPFTHHNILCTSKVAVTRSCGHVGVERECWEDEPPCTVEVPRKLPCGHTQLVQCFKEDWSTVHCKQPCTKTVPGCPLGHICPGLCCEKCPKTCHKIVSRQIDCGHAVDVECHQRNVPFVCPYPH